MASVLSPSSSEKLLTAVFTHACSSLGQNSKAMLTVLSPSSSFTWRASVKLERHIDDAIALSTALLRMVFYSYLCRLRMEGFSS